MLLSKIVDTILEKLSMRKIFLTSFLTFVESTILVYVFKITSDQIVMLVTFICAAVTITAITFYPDHKEKKPPPVKRRKK